MDVQNGEENAKDAPVSHDSIPCDRRPRHETRRPFCDPLARLLVDLELDPVVRENVRFFTIEYSDIDRRMGDAVGL
jgi:hypothetical protein